MDEPLYRIGEAARLLELETYVLRFWETEFPQLQPLRTPKGQRKYTQNHLELLQLVKYLLHQQGMTIEGARKILDRKTDPFAALGARQTETERTDGSTGLSDGNDEMILSPLPSPRTVGTPEQDGKTQVRLIQGTLMQTKTDTQPNRDRKLLQELRRELEALRGTLCAMPNSTKP